MDIKNLLFFSKKKKEISNLKFGDIALRLVFEDTIRKESFVALTADPYPVAIGEEVQMLTKVPSEYQSAEFNARQMSLRSDNGNTIQYFGTKDNSSILQDNSVHSEFSAATWVDLKGNVLNNSNLPYDTWMIGTYECITAFSGNSSMFLGLSSTNGLVKTQYLIRGFSFGTEVWRADEINGIDWVGSDNWPLAYRDLINEPDVSTPELIELKV